MYGGYENPALRLSATFLVSEGLQTQQTYGTATKKPWYNHGIISHCDYTNMIMEDEVRVTATDFHSVYESNTLMTCKSCLAHRL